MKSRLSVLVATGAEQPIYTYSVEDTPVEDLIGAYVEVPFGRGKADGIIVPFPPDSGLSENKIKAISQNYCEELALPAMPSHQLAFMEWMAGYTMTPQGMIAKMALSSMAGSNGFFRKIKPNKQARPLHFGMANPDHAPPTLSSDQQKTTEIISAEVRKGGFSTHLIEGVTGSGKTEVYFDAVAAALRLGKQALILLPEIALSGQFIDRFRECFGCAPAVWHSDLTPRQRRETWLAIARNKVQAVIGARSALFLPFYELACIVIDEEHDPSYKQSEGVSYHARDMAIMRAKFADIPALLASATPALETRINAKQGKYHHHLLPKRHGSAQLPALNLIDIKRHKLPAECFITPPLQQALIHCFEKKQQAMLFLNRRGYAPLLLCRNCGHRFACPDCTAWLVTHRPHGKPYLACHHCGIRQPAPNHCPQCQETEHLAACGPGIERLHEEAKQLFPDVRITLASSETLSHANSAQQFLTQVQNNEVDLIIGTQIIAKGYHFPNLTLVGVIDADLGLQGGDLRAGERCYQLMNQVAGRAGRAQLAGAAYLQTAQPDAMVMQALISGDADQFYDAEEANRRNYLWPPFVRCALIHLIAKQEPILDKMAIQLAQHIPTQDDLTIFGPATPHLARLKNHHRRLFLVKAPRKFPIQNAIRDWLNRSKLPSSIKLRIDIDPYHFS